MGFFFDSFVVLQALKSLLIRSDEPCFSAVPGPMQQGVRSSSVFTFLILPKVFMLVSHSSVTTFKTNFFFYFLTLLKKKVQLSLQAQFVIYIYFFV